VLAGTNEVKIDNMRSELKNAFRIAFEKRVGALGYTRSFEAVSARDLAPGVIGCIGYLTSGTLQAIKPFVGVQFEHVERIYEEVTGPLRVLGKSTPRYLPTLFRDLYNLKEEQSADPDFRSTQSAYLSIELDTVSDVRDRILTEVQLYGIPYIEANTTLTNAAATMAEGRGGGIGTVAYKLPIIYWILGMVDESKAYMASIATKNYPIGAYERYIALLAARMDAGPALGCRI
jgi:hypothetical protein